MARHAHLWWAVHGRRARWTGRRSAGSVLAVRQRRLPSRTRQGASRSHHRGIGRLRVLGAFLGGLLAILSPCSALLLPSFFAYAFEGLGTLLARTGIFFLGLAAVLVPLGAGGAVGSAITTYRSQTTFVSALVIMAFGVMILLGKGFNFGVAQRIAGNTLIATRLSVFILGAAYGLAGFCSGPLLGAVLTVGGQAPYGALLMAVYAAGMTVPLAVLAAL